ncbi:type IV pilus modification protein PilV [Solemya velesiana gill symbiont]|uniref:type IV pilus modification protein PilV n=1 Tax=Solemya velesiana gill symbiont TaxID=1918948 RepID=UPI001FECF3C2|nr:type IV pilus modification protein PilV [Solemya velesiana gill symbiont]
MSVKTRGVELRSGRSAMGGFTLIEVLVTVVVLSIGLLGLAGLQAVGIKVNHDSLIRSTASLAASDLTDRIRSNRSNIAQYAVTMADTSSPYGGTTAGDDVDAWLAYLSSSLPEGDGSVVIAGDRATVTVRWTDRRAESVSDKYKSFSVVADI